MADCRENRSAVRQAAAKRMNNTVKWFILEAGEKKSIVIGNSEYSAKSRTLSEVLFLPQSQAKPASAATLKAFMVTAMVWLEFLSQPIKNEGLARIHKQSPKSIQRQISHSLLNKKKKTINPTGEVFSTIASAKRIPAHAGRFWV